MNINTSNYYSSSASSSKGISGLVSGLDTDSMVEQMLSGTQKKIDAQKALKQQTEWKQEMYRDVITSINAFSDKYFDLQADSTLSTNFASGNLFNAMISKIKSGDAVRLLTTGVGAAAGDFRVAVKQLASASTMTSSAKMSGDYKIVGTALDDAELAKALDKTLELEVGGTTVRVDLNQVNTGDGMTRAINRALTDAGVDAEAKLYDGQLRVLAQGGTSISVGEGTSALALEMTGLTAAHTSPVAGVDGAQQTMLYGSQTKPTAGISFTMDLDGVQKQIDLSLLAGDTGDVTKDSVCAALQKAVNDAFGTAVDVRLNADGALELGFTAANADGHQLKITGWDATKIGLTPGASTHISTSTKLQDLAGAAGERFRFAINGKEFSFDAQDTVGDVINAINNSDAGVRMTYSSLSDTFTLTASSTGKDFSIRVQQQEGNLMSVLFGADKVAAGSAAATRRLTVDAVRGAALEEDAEIAGGTSMRFKVNGESYTFSLDAKRGGGTYTRSETETVLNDWLSRTFGTGEDGRANLTYDAAQGTLAAADGYVVEFDRSTADLENPTQLEAAKKKDLALVLGFNLTDNSNVAGADTRAGDVQQLRALVDAGAVAADTQLSALTTLGGYGVSFSEGRLVAADNGSGEIALSNEAMASLFGRSPGDAIALGDGAMAADAATQGGDAIVILNGVETTRSSNTLVQDGLTMELTKVSAQDAAGNYTETVIGTERDADHIVDAFKSFVKDYNALIEKLNDYVDADTDYRKYAPLTPAQEDEMSESQIEKWNVKAKTGLLHRDSTIDTFLTQIRTALYTKPAGASLALYDIGVETSDQWRDKGKLTFDESALRNALASDPAAVEQLFLAEEGGLADRLTEAVKSVANLSSGSPGALVQVAGMKGWASATNNTLTNQIRDIENKIKDLENKYASERDRYWNQFNAMEQILANYNSQSAMISSYFSSGY